MKSEKIRKEFFEGLDNFKQVPYNVKEPTVIGYIRHPDHIEPLIKYPRKMK